MLTTTFSDYIIDLIEKYRQKEIARLSLIQTQAEEESKNYKLYANMIQRFKNQDHENLVRNALMDAMLWSDERSEFFVTRNR